MARIIDQSGLYDEIITKYISNGFISPRDDYNPCTRAVISVSGASGTGKTTFGKGLDEELNRSDMMSGYIGMDGYMKNRRTRDKEGLSGYDPESHDIKSIVRDMDSLIFDGKGTDIRLYSEDDEKITTRVEPSEIIILDGVISLHHEIRMKYPNFKIFLYSDEPTLKYLRFLTDIQEREHSIDSAAGHSESEYEAYKRWVQSHMHSADVILFVNEKREMKLEEMRS